MTDSTGGTPPINAADEADEADSPETVPSIRTAFEAKFGEELADAMCRAAESHKNGVHDKPGSDPFKWAIAICIGYECIAKPDYRKHHDIPDCDPAAIKTWVYEHGDLRSHDGDFDYLAVLGGAYDGWIAVQVSS